MSKDFVVSEVIENVPIADNTFRMRLVCPDLASEFQPGQFVMIRISGVKDPLLGRPLAVYNIWSDDQKTPAGVDVVYVAVGKGTRLFSDMRPGQSMEIWGPLGNGFPAPVDIDHLILLSGGVGQTPMLTVAQEALGLAVFSNRKAKPPKRVSFCYGARSKNAFAGLNDFADLQARAAVPFDIYLTTDDGSLVPDFNCRQGFAVNPMEDIFLQKGSGDHSSAGNTAGNASENRRMVYACGPRPMLIAAQELLAKYSIPGKVSLESPMACGLGICFSCVAKILSPDGSWDYKRTCKEGPVFDADKVLWD